MMRSEFETLNKPWGDVHVFSRGERRLPAPGSVSGQPLFVASDAVFDDGAWKVTYGYAFAMAVSFGARTEAATMVPFGASEDPVSPHYDDQMKLIQGRRLKPTRFDPEEVRRFAASAYGSVVRVSPPGMESEFTIHAQGPVSVTAKIDTKPAVAIPGGLATFTVYAQIDQLPDCRQGLVEMKIYIPEEVCSNANLGRLAVYGYDPAQGWAPLQAQELDANTRIISARDRHPRTYAVLGPSAARIAPNPFVRQLVAKAVPNAKPLIEKAESELPPPQSVTTPPPQAQDMTAGPTAPVPGAPAPSDALAPTAAGPAPTPLVDSASPLNPDRAAPGGPQRDSPPSMPVMQMGLPAAPAAGRDRKEGALAWGKKMQLRPPGSGTRDGVRRETGGRALVVSRNRPVRCHRSGRVYEVRKGGGQGDGTPIEVTVHLRAVDSVAGRGCVVEAVRA